jgi:hypothetical protein
MITPWKAVVCVFAALFAIVSIDMFVKSKTSQKTLFKLRIFGSAGFLIIGAYAFFDSGIRQLSTHHKLFGISEIIKTDEGAKGVLCTIIAILLLLFGFNFEKLERLPRLPNR